MGKYTAAAAARMRHVTVPSSLAIISRVLAMRQQGIRVINFNTRGGTPQRAKQAAIAMLESGAAASYTDVRGLLALRQAIAGKLLRENAIQANPESEILVTMGGMAGLFATLLALVDPGDEVVVTEPSWLAFEPMVSIAGGTMVRVPLSESQGFAFGIDEFRKRISSRTKLLILCNPDNPTGKVYARSELEAIAALAKELDLLVIVDEAYESFVYDGLRHVSTATLEGMKSRTITVHTVSKIHNMFGWRIGWVVADARIIEPILAVHACAVSCPTSFAQAGAVAVLDGSSGEGDQPVAEIVRCYQEQRDAMVKALRAIPGVTCAVPQGAYFMFPKFPNVGMSSAELSSHLLEAGHVATTPGSAFGLAGEGHLRLVFNAPVPEIEQGVGQIADALARLNRR